MRLEGKSRFAWIIGTLPCLLAVAAALACAPAQAQDTSASPAASEPAPVLRGFRLDQDKPKADPPPPTATVPPASETPKAAQPRPTQQPRAEANQPAPKRNPPTPAENAASTSTEPTAQPPASTTETPATTQPATEQIPAEPSTVTVPSTPSDNGLWWKLAAAFAALAFVVAGLWWLRRQSQGSALEEPQAEVVERPVAPISARPAQAAPTPVAPPVKPAPPPPATQKPAAEAPIMLEFIPDRAVVSIANLSVTGKLRLTNRTDKPVENLRLRAGLIGASSDQAEIISAFHNRDDGSEKPLADLKPGEKRAFAIDMALPLADMPSYMVGTQRLLVPIVIANLGYGQGQNDQVELACVVGREANPPQPKLGPLRLDLGPRSFSPLGQRQLAA